MRIKVVTDSGGLMTCEQAKAVGIDYLPLQVTIGDKTYLDGVNLTTSYLYDEMEKGLFHKRAYHQWEWWMNCLNNTKKKALRMWC